MTNKFIVFEGVDHSGKGTQIELLKQYLRDNDKDQNIVFTREPGGFNLPICEKIRELLLDPNNQIEPIAEAYLYAASRSQHVNFIINSLYNNKIVICDRYYYSSLVYQGIVRGLGLNNVKELNKLAMQGTEPDIVFHIKIDMDTFIKRRQSQDSLDRLEQENLDFFEKILNAYDTMFKMEGLFQKTKLIELDGRKSPDEIHKEIIKHIK